MKKQLKKVMAVTLSSAMVLSTAACGNSSAATDSTTTVAQSGETTTAAGSTAETTTGADSGASYTWNLAMSSSPLNWNPHSWEMSSDSELMSYLEMPLVDVSIGPDGETFEWVFEMADNITDITATYADRDKYGITEDEGRVFQIDLNPLAKWEDGTPINADSYVYSMQQMINPDMKNYRANAYVDGDINLYNGNAYFNNDKAGETKYSTIGALGYSTPEEAIAAGCTDLQVDMSGFWGVTDEDGNGMFSVEDETKLRDSSVADETAEGAYVTPKEVYEGYLCEGTDYVSYAPDYVYAADGVYEAVDFSEVGFVKTGDYQIVYITEAPVEMFYFLTGMMSSFLVKEDLYEANKVTTEGLTSTSYGTSVDNYMAYGPYKLVSFETDKQFVLERNENWYGYTDGKHEGQYQTTRVVYDIVPDHNTALQLFNSGKLDYVTLTSDDMEIYRMSDYLMKTDVTYTTKWTFATDLAALEALEVEANDGANKRVLSYKDFREAISYSMDRQKITTECTAGDKPAFYLLNYLYYTDIANDPESQYRKTEPAMEAVLNLYGIEYGEGKQYKTVEEAYNAVTGYDVEKARELFQSAYEQAIADGNYTDGQEVHITCMCSASSTMTPNDVAQQDLMNDFVAEATVGTGFEGKITFTFQSGSATRYADVAAGKIEMIRGAWGGAAFYPFSIIRVYCEPDYMGGTDKINETCGWDPTTDTFDVTYDFDGDGTAETVTDTFQNWAKSINGGGAYVSDTTASLYVLSALETAILATYQSIPWGTQTEVAMYSQKVQYATLDYNIMYGYGGIRLMTYNYTDEEWDAYVASQGGTLSYE